MKKRKQSSDLFLNALFTTFIVLIIVFSTLRLIPGDPEESILGENASPIQRELLREQLGLNQPIHTQLKQYFFNLARFDLGTSISKKTKVSTLIKERLPNTVILAVIAILIASIFGIPLGAFHSWHPNHWISKVSSFLSILFLSMPSFWIGPLFVILFSLHYPWLPFSGFKSWDSIVLPAFTLGIGMGSVIYRITSAAIKDCLQKDYLRLARAKGCSEFQILFFHALPNAALPILLTITLQFGHLLAGAVVTETIFDWPGIGSLAFDAISSRDYPIVQAVVIMITLFFVLINWVTDWIKNYFIPGEI